MLSVFCPQHGTTVLITASQIERIDNVADGLEVHYHCVCGEPGVLLTGRRRPAA